MADRTAQLILEKIHTPEVEEMRGLEDIVRGSEGFGSTGVNKKNDTDVKKELKCEKERTDKKDDVKNETLKDKVDNGKRRIDKRRKATKGTSRLSHE